VHPCSSDPWWRFQAAHHVFGGHEDVLQLAGAGVPCKRHRLPQGRRQVGDVLHHLRILLTIKTMHLQQSRLTFINSNTFA